MLANDDSDVEFDDREESDSDDDYFELEEEEQNSGHSDIESADDELEVQTSASAQHLFLSKDKKIQYSADPLPFARPPPSVVGIISNEGNFLLKMIANKNYMFCIL